MDLNEEAVRNIREVAARVLKPKSHDKDMEKANGNAMLRGIGNVVGDGNIVLVVSAANDTSAGAVPTQGSHDEKWRKRRIARILSICKELNRRRQLEQLLAASYGAVILIELNDDQLDEVFRLVSTWA